MSFPGRHTGCVVVPMTLSDTTILDTSVSKATFYGHHYCQTYLFPNAGEAANFPSLVYGLNNPVDSRISTDLSLMSREAHRIIPILTALWLGSTSMTS